MNFCERKRVYLFGVDIYRGRDIVAFFVVFVFPSPLRTRFPGGP